MWSAFANINWNFNSHAHVERDALAVVVLKTYNHFNSHAHVERDVELALCRLSLNVFQLTRSRGA